MDFTGITQLTLFGAADEPPTQLPAISGLPLLRELVVEHFNCSEAQGLQVFLTELIGSLNVLKVRHCHIKEFELPVGSDLDVLDLSHNSLQYLCSRMIRDSKVKRLIIRHNGYSGQLFPHERGANTSVRELDASYNEIPVLEQHTCWGLPNLEYLYVTDNEIDYIEPRVWNKICKLKIFDASRNKLTRIAPRDMKFLIGVVVAHNEITEIYCVRSPNLVILDVAGNKLSAVVNTYGSFNRTTPNLRLLITTGNPLKDTHPDLASLPNGIQIIHEY